MKKEFSDELISAYLDDELSADERKQVEQLLVDSAEYRQMFNELRALRGSLQKLPSYKPDDHFTDRVVRLAQQAMSSDSEVESVPTPESASSWRIAAIIISAVAAMLLISVVSLSDWNHGRPKLAQSNVDASQQNVAANEASKEAPETTSSESETLENSTQGSFADAGAGDTAPLPSEDDSANRSDAFRITTSPGKAGERPANPSGNDAPFADKELAETPAPATSSSAPMPKTNSLGETADRIARNETDKEDSVVMTAPRAEPSVDLKYQVQADDQYVVFVDFTKQAFEKRALDIALRQNGINLVPSLRGLAEARDEQADTPSDSIARAKKNQPASRLAMLPQAAQPGNVDVVIVEASAAQIEATFDDLDSSGYLLAMNVHNERAAQGLPRLSAPSRETTESFSGMDGRQLFARLMERKVAGGAVAGPQSATKNESLAGGSSFGGASPKVPSAPKQEALPGGAAKDVDNDELAKQLKRDAPSGSQEGSADPRSETEESQKSRRKLSPADDKSSIDADRNVAGAAEGEEAAAGGVAVRVVPPMSQDFRVLGNELRSYSRSRVQSALADQLNEKGKEEEKSRAGKDGVEKLVKDKPAALSAVEVQRFENAYRQQLAHQDSKVRVVFVIRAVEPAIAAQPAAADAAAPALKE